MQASTSAAASANGRLSALNEFVSPVNNGDRFICTRDFSRIEQNISAYLPAQKIRELRTAYSTLGADFIFVHDIRCPSIFASIEVKHGDLNITLKLNYCGRYNGSGAGKRSKLTTLYASWHSTPGTEVQDTRAVARVMSPHVLSRSANRNTQTFSLRPGQRAEIRGRPALMPNDEQRESLRALLSNPPFRELTAGSRAESAGGKSTYHNKEEDVLHDVVKRRLSEGNDSDIFSTESVEELKQVVGDKFSNTLLNDPTTMTDPQHFYIGDRKCPTVFWDVALNSRSTPLASLDELVDPDIDVKLQHWVASETPQGQARGREDGEGGEDQGGQWISCSTRAHRQFFTKDLPETEADLEFLGEAMKSIVEYSRTRSGDPDERTFHPPKLPFPIVVHHDNPAHNYKFDPAHSVKLNEWSSLERMISSVSDP